METVEIAVEGRTERGRGAVRRLRQAGRIPAILYGPNRETLSVAVGRIDFERKVAPLEGAHLIRLQLTETPGAGVQDKMVLVRETQRHPVTGEVLHADFYEVDLTERQQVSVSLHFIGKAAGVVAGGILQPILREIVVECLPTEIPEFIEIDVSGLGIHDAVHVSDLTLPSGVTAVAEATQAVVTVVPPTIEAPAAEAEAAAPAAEAGAAPAAPTEAAAAGATKKGGAEG